MDEADWGLEIDEVVICVKCHRTRPFPEPGKAKLLMSIPGKCVFLLDTHIQCGDGGMGCQETRIRVALSFE